MSGLSSPSLCVAMATIHFSTTVASFYFSGLIMTKYQKDSCILDVLPSMVNKRLKMEGESGALKIKPPALGKVSKYLQDVGILLNKVHTDSAEINKLQEKCTVYFNLLAFPDDVNLTVWTAGYAKPTMQSYSTRNTKWVMRLFLCRQNNPNIHMLSRSKFNK